MLKRNWILMMLVVLSLVAGANGEVDNWFYTGDMEQGGDEWTPPLHWSQVGVEPGQGTVGVSTDTPTGTGQSLWVRGYNDEYGTYSHDYSRDDTLSVRYPESDFDGTEEFTLSFDYKGDVYTSFYGGTEGGYIWERVTEWTHYEATIIADAGTHHFSMYLYDNSAAGQDAWMDNVSLVAVEAPPELLMGDANRDGQVSAGDYASVQANFGNVGVENDPELYGDANLDGQVSAGDYASVQANFGNVLPTAVPEPATLSLLAIGGLVMLRKRRGVRSK